VKHAIVDTTGVFAITKKRIGRSNDRDTRKFRVCNAVSNGDAFMVDEMNKKKRPYKERPRTTKNKYNVAKVHYGKTGSNRSDCGKGSIYETKVTSNHHEVTCQTCLKMMDRGIPDEQPHEHS